MGEEYQCTDSCNVSGSPMTTLSLDEESEGDEYAVAAKMSASWPFKSGLVCSSTFILEFMCK